jgi:hypothetical protein
MSGEDKSFSIKDRRLFTPEGRLREDEAQAAGPASDARPPSTPAQPRRSGPAEVDFARFLMSLGAQALEALQAQPAALDQAQTLVAVLEMLRDKSEGRRTPEESEVLEGLLYELRMTFVERSRVEPA